MGYLVWLWCTRQHLLEAQRITRRLLSLFSLLPPRLRRLARREPQPCRVTGVLRRVHFSFQVPPRPRARLIRDVTRKHNKGRSGRPRRLPRHSSRSGASLSKPEPECVCLCVCVGVSVGLGDADDKNDSFKCHQGLHVK